MVTRRELIRGVDKERHYLEVLPKSLPSTIFELDVEEMEEDKILETTWMISNRMGTYGKSKELALSESKVKSMVCLC